MATKRIAVVLAVAALLTWSSRAVAAWREQGVAAAPTTKPSGTVSPAPLPGAGGSAPSSDTADPNADILDLDVDQLGKVDVKVPSMDVEVTSVSKQESTVGRSAAAVFVITNEMIRRSGVTSVPEALRMAPGVEVARVKSNMWAISIRGFQNRFANKLLVLVDGRSVYDQYFSGVYWDVQDMVLEDIDRIEVIRGPGGTLWGANAVNGVINIITKKAQDTQGTLVTTGGGNLEHSINQVRAGGNNGKGTYWRVHGKATDIGQEVSNAQGGHDDWRVGRGGFRVDCDLDRCQQDTMTVLGNFFGGEEGYIAHLPMPVSPFSWTAVDNETVAGENVLARWTRKFSDESDFSFQIYFDRAFREQVLFKQEATVLDVELQHRFPLGRRQNIIWGLESRNVHSYIPNVYTTPYTPFDVTLDPVHESYRCFGGFIQDEIALSEDEWTLTVGTKLDQNSYTGFEAQPSIRLLWTPDRRHAVWGAISRAVRTPSRVERTSLFHYGPFYRQGVPLPVFLEFSGNPQLKAETLMAYELGYRTQATDRFAWDVAVFANAYEDKGEWHAGNPDIGPVYVTVPESYSNSGSPELYGAEVTGQWSMTDAWRLFASYGATRMCPDMAGSALGHDGYPRNQARFQSQWDLAKNWEFDAVVRYVDNVVGQNTPNYITMDLRLGWNPRKDLQIALVGTNLLDDHHPEFGPTIFETEVTEVRRTVYAQLTWRR